MQANTHPEDICIWPDGTWCFRCNLSDFAYMGDDHLTLYVDSEEWLAFDPDRPLQRLEA